MDRSTAKMIEAHLFEGYYFVVMEHIEGSTWREAMRTNHPPTIKLDWCNPYEDLSELLDDLEGFTDLSPPMV
jgi:hypothetical protein